MDPDLKMAVGWNRRNLQLLGVWPDPTTDSSQERFAQYRFLIPGLFMLGFICGPQSANLILIWGDVDLMTENLATANIPIMNAFMKIFLLWYHREALKPLLNSVMADWRDCKKNHQRRVMLKHALVSRKISIGCLALTQTMVTLYLVLRVITVFRLDRERTNPDRLALYPAFFPYNIKKSPAFELTCVAQILSAYCAALSYTGVDSFISMLVFHVCGQFVNLQQMLRDLFDENLEPKARERTHEVLVKIVKRHEHLSWFAKTIEDCFNVLLLAQMLACTVQLCFQGYQTFQVLTQEENAELPTFQLIFLGVFVVFVMVHLYMYCYVGDMLIVQSAGMGDSAYQSKWYTAPPKESKDLVIVMLMSKMPLRLTAGKFSTFSLETFSTILKTSMGYLSVLLTVTSH